MSDWSGMCDSRVCDSACLGRCGCFNVATSSSFAASHLISSDSLVATWTCDLTKLVALRGIAFAIVFVAAALSINGSAQAVFVYFTGWGDYIRADNLFTFVAVWFWSTAD